MFNLTHYSTLTSMFTDARVRASTVAPMLTYDSPDT